ncbi:DUF6098 family protein [Isoptericola sp. NEAU-Y5]|uniref:DUF6098 family protein n=1 Tax=Isoptericola luteus TaxID=2879484 RepID=A0ABS7ZG53_9MICO|nr:DUF6098 family protein [Isoptericola sp. NEAU-Y5]MCA5893995.1 DUF6098 family protein [Isoptericola sp. NEAU-Y5]
MTTLEAARGTPDMVHLRSLAEVAELVRLTAPLYVRFSAGPEADVTTRSRDHESGCVLPGLSVNPLSPEPWWDRPLEHWLARQLYQYAHLMTPERFPWVLTGEIAGRGPDCEPLLVRTTPVASVDRAVVDEAVATYARVFRPGEDGT